MNTSYLQLRSSLYNRHVDPLKPFSQQINDGIRIRNENIQQIKLLIQRESASSHRVMDNLLQCCDKTMASSVTLLVIGSVNSGKSMLASALLDWQIVLPSSDEPTTGRLTRIVYSDRPVIRKFLIRLNNGLVGYGGKEKYAEVLESEETLDNNRLNDYIYTSQEERDDKKFMIIEIGIPSRLLEAGLIIIDCPGLDENEILSDMNLEILKAINSSLSPFIVSYVYDERKGFEITDGERLAEIERHLYFKEYIIVANKCDRLDENIADSLMNKFNEDEVKASIRQNCLWKFFIRFPFVDKDKFLTVLPISAGQLYIDRFQPNSEDTSELQLMLDNLKSKIVSKVIGLSRSILHVLIGKTGTWRVQPININLYLLLKSLTVDNNLIELISSECCDDKNLLLDFTRGYKLFGLHYLDNRIHATVISKNPMIDFDIEKRRIFFDILELPDSIVFLNDAESKIYIIEKERPHKRLIENFETLSLRQAVVAIKRLFLSLYNRSINFRPDNVFVDENGEFYPNMSIPNDPNLPFILRDKSTVKPFHLHPHLERMDAGCHKIMSFLTSLGWLIRILLDGPESQIVPATSYYPAAAGYPKELVEFMKLCHSADVDSNLRDLYIEACYHLKI